MKRSWRSYRITWSDGLINEGRSDFASWEMFMWVNVDPITKVKYYPVVIERL